MLSKDSEGSPGQFSPTVRTVRDQPMRGPRTPTGVQQPGIEAPRQERGSSSRRRTGFPGIGPLEVSPNVILFVPRRTPLGSPGANELSSPVHVRSPDHAAVHRAGETPEEERVCLRTWVLCIATLGPFILSFWMMALPLLIRAKKPTVFQPPPPVPPLPTTDQTATRRTTTPGKSSTIIPPSCFERPPNLTDASSALNLPINFKRLNQIVVKKPFFCLFDNSRFRHPGHSDFAFETLPFQLCPYVIYWSVGVENGSITSRVPRFDQIYGLERLKATINHLGFRNTVILLALGGYLEDSPHFSMFGADSRLMERFVKNVVDATIQYKLDGLTVHWVPAKPDCEGPNDAHTLDAILRNIRTLRQFRGLPPLILSVILTLNTDHVNFAIRAASVVDFFFLDTRTFNPTTKDLKTLCRSVTSTVQSTVAGFVGLSGGKLQRDQVCIVDSLAPLSANAVFNPFTGLYEPAITSTSELKRSPFNDACGADRFCRENTTDSCVVHRSFSPGVRKNATLYVVNSPTTWMERTSYAYLYGESPDKNACVLIADLDYDDYSGSCRRPYEQFILMMNFYFGAYGATGRGAPIHSVAPPC